METTLQHTVSDVLVNLKIVPIVQSLKLEGTIMKSHITSLPSKWKCRTHVWQVEVDKHVIRQTEWQFRTV